MFHRPDLATNRGLKDRVRVSNTVSSGSRYCLEMAGPNIEASADVDARAEMSDSCTVWHLAQVREMAIVGDGCVIGRGAYIGVGVRLGRNVKVQNYALVYEPAIVGDFAFIGPAAVLTNDRYPRSTEPDGRLKGSSEWGSEGVVIRTGASIGAHAVVLAGVSIGTWACVGAGAVVTRDVPDHALVVGNPARQAGWVGCSGRRLVRSDRGWTCPQTGQHFQECDNGLECVES